VAQAAWAQVQGQQVQGQAQVPRAAAFQQAAEARVFVRLPWRRVPGAQHQPLASR